MTGTAGRLDGTDVVLQLRVQPRAANDGFAGLSGERLRLRLRAPPVDGRANAALINYLSKVFSVPRSEVIIEQGLSSRDKRIRIRNAGQVPREVAVALGLGQS